METEVFTVEIPKTLADRINQAMSKSKSKGKSYAETKQSIVTTALTNFLDEIEAGDK